jgi:hypothetical protein
MKIIIEAEHTYTNQLTLEDINEGIEESGFEVSHVLLTNGDGIAKFWAEQENIEYTIFPILWDDLTGSNIKTNKFGKKYNASAGKERNYRICSEADGLIHFWWESDNSSSYIISEMKKMKKRIYIPKINTEFIF